MRRLFFTLLYDRGQFMLSRNFRLQAVGGIKWLLNNYDFSNVCHGLDELMILDVSRGPRDAETFAEHVRRIAGSCFIPMTVGGGITSFEIAQRYMRNGADKLLLNSAFHSNVSLCRSLARHFGRQCIVGGIDYRTSVDRERGVMVANGSSRVPLSLSDWADFLQENGAGELLFQSIDQDGTGMGLDLSVVDVLQHTPEVPCILMGGVGKGDQIIAGLQHPTIDAVATANLFNFIGTAFLEVRAAIAAAGVEIAQWKDLEYKLLRNRFADQSSPQASGGRR